MLKLFVQVHEMDYEMVDDHHPIEDLKEKF